MTFISVDSYCRSAFHLFIVLCTPFWLLNNLTHQFAMWEIEKNVASWILAESEGFIKDKSWLLASEVLLFQLKAESDIHLRVERKWEANSISELITSFSNRSHSLKVMQNKGKVCKPVDIPLLTTDFGRMRHVSCEYSNPSVDDYYISYRLDPCPLSLHYPPLFLLSLQSHSDVLVPYGNQDYKTKIDLWSLQWSLRGSLYVGMAFHFLVLVLYFLAHYGRIGQYRLIRIQ